VKTISFFNHKGGVGKTTLVFNVGLALARQGKTVLFVDADAQANLTSAALPVDTYEKHLIDQATIYGALLPVINNTGELVPHQATFALLMVSALVTIFRSRGWVAACRFRQPM